MVVLIMGVSSSGKTTVGKGLAKIMNSIFIDADDYHSENNIYKMKNGVGLNDEDREPWLKSLRLLMDEYLIKKEDMILACSALTKNSRSILGANRQDVKLIYLKGSKSVIKHRMENRNHFMPASLLDSQFLDLSEPSNALIVDINYKPSQLILQIHNYLK